MYNYIYIYTKRWRLVGWDMIILNINPDGSHSRQTRRMAKLLHIKTPTLRWVASRAHALLASLAPLLAYEPILAAALWCFALAHHAQACIAASFAACSVFLIILQKQKTNLNAIIISTFY